jgi:RNA polymerase sigma-B factor
VIDAATGAYTEAYFRTRLEEELHRASSEGMTVSMVLINFKGLDEMRSFYGEASVVDFMADAAEFFKNSVRRLDIVARYGDGGFGIILPSTGTNVALVRKRLISKVRGWMTSKFAVNGPVSIEVAEATSPKDGRNGTELLAAAKLRPALETDEGTSEKAA